MASPTTATTPQVCPVCTYKGITSNLKLYQINEEEAIYMCTNEKCSYPIGACDPSLFIVKRLVPELKENEDNDTLALPTMQKKEDVSNGILIHVEETSVAEKNEQEDEMMKSELDLMLDGILSEDTNNV